MSGPKEYLVLKRGFVLGACAFFLGQRIGSASSLMLGLGVKPRITANPRKPDQKRISYAQAQEARELKFEVLSKEDGELDDLRKKARYLDEEAARLKSLIKAEKAASGRIGLRKTVKEAARKLAGPLPRYHHASYPKDSLKYWLERVKRPTYTKEGKNFVAPHYAVCLSRNGQRRNLSLETSDKEEAARKAMKLWDDVKDNGWNQALANLRPVERLPSDTVGELIAAVEKGVQRSPTREGYVRAFRQVVSEVVGIKRKANTLVSISNWKARVAKVKLCDLTSEKIERWRLRRVEAAGDHLSQHATKITLNTLVRFSKALFSPKVLKQIGLEVANPFKDIGYLKAQPKKYQPTFDVRTLFKNAEAELKGEELKVFLLAICCGLRRHEVDCAEWSWFDWQRNAITLRETKWFKAKTEDSHGVVPIDPELAKRFFAFYQEHLTAMAAKKEPKQNDFVIQSVFAKPRLNKNYIRYRCDFAFLGLIKWLRANGVTGPRPIHTLRKESGSLINEAQGIHAASRFLRHSDVAITSAVYADNRGMKPISLSALSGGT